MAETIIKMISLHYQDWATPELFQGPRTLVLVISYFVFSVYQQFCPQKSPSTFHGCRSSRQHLQKRRKKSVHLHGFKDKETSPAPFAQLSFPQSSVATIGSHARVWTSQHRVGEDYQGWLEPRGFTAWSYSWAGSAGSTWQYGRRLHIWPYKI